jgi:hypothetical protein
LPKKSKSDVLNARRSDARKPDNHTQRRGARRNEGAHVLISAVFNERGKKVKTSIGATFEVSSSRLVVLNRLQALLRRSRKILLR